jgi:hypothetical protein
MTRGGALEQDLLLQKTIAWDAHANGYGSAGDKTTFFLQCVFCHRWCVIGIGAHLFWILCDS